MARDNILKRLDQSLEGEVEVDREANVFTIDNN